MAGSRPVSAHLAGLAAGSPGLAERPGWWRWQSLLGAVPLAGYVVLHLGAQLLALGAGPEQRALEAVWLRRPLWDWLVLVLVLLPLAAHAVLGVRRMASSEPQSDPFWPGALGRGLQRVSALVLAVFLCAHIWQFQGRRWLGELDRADYLAELYASLSSTALGGVPLVAMGYLLGIAAAVLHLAQGLYHAALSWGLVGEAGQRRLGQLCCLGGVCLFAVGALVVVRLATGALPLGLSASAGASLP